MRIPQGGVKQPDRFGTVHMPESPDQVIPDNRKSVILLFRSRFKTGGDEMSHLGQTFLAGNFQRGFHRLPRKDRVSTAQRPVLCQVPNQGQQAGNRPFLLDSAQMVNDFLCTTGSLLSINIEHFPDGMGRVFFFLPRMLMVK